MKLEIEPLVSMRKLWIHKKWFEQQTDGNFIGHVMWRIHEPMLWVLRVAIFALALYLAFRYL